jgi:hypothetical protein
VSADATLYPSTTTVDVAAPLVTVPGIAAHCDRDDIVKAVVTSDLDVTANITAATRILIITAATSVCDAASPTQHP